MEKTDFLVTDEKIAALVERIVAAADPLEVIVFGSRARGDHEAESDLDVAVIADDESAVTRRRVQSATDGTMAVDLLIIGKARFDEFRPWIGTVERQVDREGVRHYVRSRQSSYSQAA